MRPPEPELIRKDARDLCDQDLSFDRNALLASIGTKTFLAVSGGRVWGTPSGVILPVSDGWAVEVAYTVLDYYTVRRVRYRRAKRYVHGQAEDLDFTQVSEAVYDASCFHNGPWQAVP